MRSWGWGLHAGISALVRRETDTRGISLSSVWRHWENAAICKPEGRPSRASGHAGIPNLWLPVSKTVRKKCLFKPPSLFIVFLWQPELRNYARKTRVKWNKVLRETHTHTHPPLEFCTLQIYLPKVKNKDFLRQIKIEGICCRQNCLARNVQRSFSEGRWYRAGTQNYVEKGRAAEKE